MKNIAVLASGRGSNLYALMSACKRGSLDAKIALVISNNANAKALELASQANINNYYLDAKAYPDAAMFDQDMTAKIIAAQIDLVVLAGYMRKVGPILLRRFRNRVINIHPSLLPKFGGCGMYGLRVHQAVIAAGETETGVTVHVVDAEYDSGMILAQESVPVYKEDTAAHLAARVLAVEHQLYPEVINKIINGQIDIAATQRSRLQR